jgi:hypothetical protein
MSQAIFDLCYFDEITFDYGVPVFVAAARLDIVIGNKSMLAIDLSTKADLQTTIGEKVRMASAIGMKVNMLVASGSKSSLGIELLGGGA